MVDFAGWEMPVQYAGILEEHRAVRENCGIFDISHMGEFVVRGTEASAWLDSLLTNRVAALETGQAQYSLMLNERGGVIDDLIVYRTAAAGVSADCERGQDRGGLRVAAGRAPRSRHEEARARQFQ